MLSVIIGRADFILLGTNFTITSFIINNCLFARPNSRKNSFVDNLFRSRRILLTFCPEHDSHTAVLCAKFQKDSSTIIDIMGQRYFAIFQFNTDFWGDSLFCYRPQQCTNECYHHHHWNLKQTCPEDMLFKTHGIQSSMDSKPWSSGPWWLLVVTQVFAKVKRWSLGPQGGLTATKGRYHPTNLRNHLKPILTPRMKIALAAAAAGSWSMRLRQPGFHCCPMPRWQDGL